MDFSFLRYYADNPVALIMLLVGAVVIIYTGKILPLKIERMWSGSETGKKSEAGQKTKEIKKEGFIPHLDKTLERIEYKIDNMEKRLNHVDKSALMGNIYNPALPIVERLRAFVRYLKLGENGLVAEFAIKELVFPNREEWMRTVHECQMKSYCSKYDERIAEINRKISQN